MSNCCDHSTSPHYLLKQSDSHLRSRPTQLDGVGFVGEPICFIKEIQNLSQGVGDGSGWMGVFSSSAVSR